MSFNYTLRLRNVYTDAHFRTGTVQRAVPSFTPRRRPVIICIDSCRLAIITSVNANYIRHRRTIETWINTCPLGKRGDITFAPTVDAYDIDMMRTVTATYMRYH